METAGSLFILAFFVLIPIAMAVLLLILAVKRREAARTWRTVGAAVGLELIEQGSSERQRLGEMLFTLHPRSDHRIAHALAGEVDGRETWVASAQTVNKAPAGQRYAVTRMVTCVEARGIDEILLLARPTSAKHGSSLLEHAKGLERPESERWSWVRTNAPGVVADLAPEETSVDALRSLMEPGDALVVFPRLLVHLRQLDNSVHTAAIESYIVETSERARALIGLSADLSRRGSRPLG